MVNEILYTGYIVQMVDISIVNGICSGISMEYVNQRTLFGWWFGTFGLFLHNLWEESSQLTNSYFSEGLKPPSGFIYHSTNG